MSAATPTRTPRLHPKGRLQRDHVRGGDVLLYPEGLVTLNATGAEILGLCDGTRSLAGIAATLEQRYGARDLEPEITAFLDALAARGLILFDGAQGAGSGTAR